MVECIGGFDSLPRSRHDRWLRKEEKKGLNSDRVALVLLDIIDMVGDIQEGKVTTEVGLKAVKDNLWRVTRDLVKESLVDASV